MKMKKLISFFSLIIIFQSCTDPENTVNFVLDKSNQVIEFNEENNIIRMKIKP